jgi:hypothetical protein
VLSDEPGEAKAVDADGNAAASWIWNSCCNDGGVYGPLDYPPGSYEKVTIQLSGLAGVAKLSLRDGRGSVYELPSLTAPLTIFKLK